MALNSFHQVSPSPRAWLLALQFPSFVRKRVSRLLRKVAVSGLMVAVVLGSHAQPLGVDKAQINTRMLELSTLMRDLKPRLATDRDAAIQYESADLEYRNLSALMGGDKPVVPEFVPRAARTNFLKLAPSSPPLCTPTAATYSQTTPVAIPTGPGVVTSTIVVSGANPWIWDVDLTTFIQHTFAADLDITITSPAGTVVTLTTDNGAGNDNVFNGTVWDDSAPETATDYVYANNVVAPSLVPEEALSAFVGENPNGTWTITISDDLAGDGGSLDSWSLAISALPTAPQVQTVTYAQNTPTAIADVATSSSTLLVAGAGASILDVKVTTYIQHTFSADLDITLVSPGGTAVTLTTDNAAGNDNVFNGTVWYDKANPAGQVPYTTNDGLASDHAYVNNTLASPLVPEGALGALMGQDPNGTWQLNITDDLAGDTGLLTSWSLEVTTATCPSPLIASTPGPAVAGSAYGPVTLSATGGVAPYSWSGSLPSGMSLTSGGQLSGTPALGSEGNYTVTVTDSHTPTANTADVTLQVTAATLAITTSSLPDASWGQPYTAALMSSGGTPTYSWTASGLPAGLSVSGNQIVGTPSESGTFTVTLTLMDSGSPAQSATAILDLAVTAVVVPSVQAVPALGEASLVLLALLAAALGLSQRRRSQGNAE
ncbi:IPTL-CTERM sorting domain-containing protein [Ottowia thiooxydans]|uniref:Subtilisin-like proprotein convertase family protein n=1 Tax=Ottowia thiooxydans TaxID=219182 RepID=A0ABV2QDA7_9BURK